MQCQFLLYRYIYKSGVLRTSGSSATSFLSSWMA